MRATALLVLLALGCATGDPRGRGGDAGRTGDGGGGGLDGGGDPIDGGGAPIDGGGSPIDSGGPVDAGRDAGPPDAFVPPFDSGTTCTSGEMRPCSTSCATVGTALCSGGVLGACAPPAEICDNVDQDCDGAVDDGLMRPCTTACGMGSERCVAGAWIGCTARMPVTETCDNTDQDCDGAIDDGVSRTCSTACGSGTETCSAGAFGACSAWMPASETCNGMDEDCDGRVDEDFRVRIHDPVPMSEITAAQPPCTGPTSGMDVCMSAAHRWCTARPGGCYVGGAGHLQATPSTSRVACFGSGAEVRGATFAEVSAASSISVTASNVYTRVAQSAVNRYCRSAGFEAGIGPVEHSDPTLYALCLPSTHAAYTEVLTTQLQARGCNPLASPDAFGCQTASDLECRARGHQGGYGPVEWNSTDSAIVCFR